MESFLGIIARSVVIYLFIIIAIRLSGKKEITQLSIIDLVFILLISNAVQNAMVGQNSSLLGGLVAAGSLFILNRLFGMALFRFRSFDKLLEGSPLMLIYKGKTIPMHLRKAEITPEELEAAVREHGVAEIHDVDLAVLEVDGNISVLSDNFQRKSVRRRRIYKPIIELP